MKPLLSLIALTIFFSSPSIAAPVGDTYGGIQYSIVTYERDGSGNEAEPTAAIGRFGQFLTNQVAIEARFGIGLQDDELSNNFDLEIDQLMGVYAVFHASGDIRSTFYGVLGFTQAEFSTSGSSNIEGDESGLSYGIGANINSFNIEFMSYLDDDDFDATALAFGYTTRF